MKNSKKQFAVLALTLFMFPALSLLAARPAQAQTEAVLYNFTGGSDGASPQGGGVPDGAGNFYGTTSFGGALEPGWSFGAGAVFELSPNGAGGWNETVLYSFTGGANGAYPYSPLMCSPSMTSFCCESGVFTSSTC